MGRFDDLKANSNGGQKPPEFPLSSKGASGASDANPMVADRHRSHTRRRSSGATNNGPRDYRPSAPDRRSIPLSKSRRRAEFRSASPRRMIRTRAPRRSRRPRQQQILVSWLSSSFFNSRTSARSVGCRAVSTRLIFNLAEHTFSHGPARWCCFWFADKHSLEGAKSL